MKKMIILMSLMLGFNSNARSLHPDTYAQFAELLTWDFAEDSSLRDLRAHGGKVVVNTVSKTVRIDMLVAPRCPEGRYCIQALRPQTIAELPLVEVMTDRCKITTYRAFKDQMPVDGTKEEIIIKDYSKTPCEINYLAPTTIDYNVTYYARPAGVLVKQHSSFTADALK